MGSSMFKKTLVQTTVTTPLLGCLKLGYMVWLDFYSSLKRFPFFSVDSTTWLEVFVMELPIPMMVLTIEYWTTRKI
jgi:hypothetical protein